MDTIPPNMQVYYELVWQFVRQVPTGRVVTYGQLSQTLTPPDGTDPAQYAIYGSRWVGSAMAACPEDVPWHRVVNSQGKISQRQGAEVQRVLLEDEGVLLAKGKIDLKMYQWHGPDGTEVARQGRLF